MYPQNDDLKKIQTARGLRKNNPGNEQHLEEHLAVKRYGNFLLTDAIRPSYSLPVIPKQGYRHEVYNDPKSGKELPLVMASASSEILFSVFLDLLNPLGEIVDVILESSHMNAEGPHEDLYRSHIDMPILKSKLWDFEEMLLNDGCCGIAVMNPGNECEVQFDEHKMLVMYGEPLSIYTEILHEHGIHLQNEIQFISEADHVHTSKDEFRSQFDELAYSLGVTL